MVERLHDSQKVHWFDPSWDHFHTGTESNQMPRDPDKELRESLPTLGGSAITWSVMTGPEGEIPGTWEGLDTQRELRYLLDDAREEDDEPDPDYWSGPSLASWAYDPTSPPEGPVYPAEMHENMVLFRYLGPEDQRALIKLLEEVSASLGREVVLPQWVLMTLQTGTPPVLGVH